ncbi:MAG TPA: response regulator [Candidatus Binataceae bacterium]|nr:response regulator [Candidatus Binataceae bacterium]
MAPANDSVMVVEDDAESRAHLTQLLQLEGFKVVACSNGAEALDYLTHSAPPCVIIMDIRMPVMDGAEFRAAMLRDARLTQIPVVVITAFEPPAAAKLSALRVFRKPIDFDSLLGVIKKTC